MLESRFTKGSTRMPLYEYECKKCHHHLEKIQHFNAPPEKVCPECGGELERVISAPAFQFKGSGWYVTDYAKSGSTTGSSTDTSHKSGNTSDQSSTTDGSKSDSSTAKPAAQSTDSSSSAANAAISGNTSSAGSGNSGSSTGKSD